MNRRLVTSEYSKVFWFESLLRKSQEQQLYHLCGIYEYKIKPDKNRLKAALQALVNNYYNLRSYYREEDGVLIQYIHDTLTVNLDCYEVNNQSEYQTTLEEVTAKPFNLQEGPLFRFAYIINNSNQTVTFAPIFHHIIIDGTAFDQLMTQVGEYYQQLPDSDSSDRDEIDKLQDYLHWEQKQISQADINYWQRKLKGFSLDINFTPKNSLNTDYSKDVIKHYQFDEQVYNGLLKMSQSSGISIFHILKTALALLISQYTHQDKIVIGYPFNTRSQQFKDVKGAFLNMSLFNFEKQGSFLNCLFNQRDEQYKQHRYVPISKIISDVKNNGDLLSVAISQADLLINGPFLEEIPKYTIKLPSITKGFTLIYNNHNNYLQYVLIGSSKFFDEQDLDQFAEHFACLLTQITENPQQDMSKLSCISEQEYRKIVSQWNDTDDRVLNNKTMSQLFEEQVARSPHEIALVFDNLKLTYQELNESANHLARYLRHVHRKQMPTKLQANTLIPISLEPGLDMVIAMLAILKAGGAYIAIDPDYQEKQIQLLLDDIKPSVLLTVRVLAHRITQKAPMCKVIILDEIFGFSAPSSNLPKYACAEDLANVVYNSEFQGVLIEHQSIINTATAINKAYQVGPKMKIALFVDRADSSIAEIFTTLINGGELHLLDKRQTKSQLLLGEYLSANSIEVCNLPAGGLSVLPRIDYPRLKRIFMDDQSCETSTVLYWLSKLQIFKFYGEIETGKYTLGKQVTLNNIHDIGKPIANSKAYILDVNHCPAPIGVLGELYITGLGLARGYLNQEGPTNHNFINNPFASEEDERKGYTRLFKTSQLARWLPNGNLELIKPALGQISVTIPEEENPITADQSSANLNEPEQLIYDIWSELLQERSLDINATFFELGGNSLLAVKMRSKLEKQFNVSISIVDIFEHTTIGKLAEYLCSIRKNSSVDPSSATNECLLTSKCESNSIAVVGMACRIPGASNPNEFWKFLIENKTSIRDYSDNELVEFGVSETTIANQAFVKRGAFLEDCYNFDADFFNYSCKEAEIMDPQQRHFLECAWEALEQSGNIPGKYAGEIGVFASQGKTDYGTALLAAGLADTGIENYQLMINNDKDFMATKVSYKLNLTGPSLNVQTGCSSSLVAIQMACESLTNRHCDLALAGGVFLNYQPGHLYQEGMIFSPDGYVRTFDANAKGTVAGSGVGIVVLKRLADALNDHDTIYAVIKGGAINNDGADKIGYTAPGLIGQMKLIEKALKNANLTADQIDYVETHGTGTPLGDPIEWTALHKVYEKCPPNKRACLIGALKTNIGHTDTAAGVLGFIKTVLALHHGVIPATLNFQKLNPEIACFNTLFNIATHNVDWSHRCHLKRAAISSFGIGGTNAHLILEEYRQNKLTKESGPYLIPFSAKNRTALLIVAKRLNQDLISNNHSVGNIAFTAQEGRAEFEERGFIVAQNQEKTILHKTFIKDITVNPSNAAYFIFSDSVRVEDLDLFRRLADKYQTFRCQLEKVSAVIKAQLNIDLLSCLKTSSPLSSIAFRLGTFAVQYAFAKFLMKIGIIPQAIFAIGQGAWIAAALLEILPLEKLVNIVIANDQAQLLSHQKLISSHTKLGLVSPDNNTFASQDDLTNHLFWSKLLHTNHINSLLDSIQQHECLIAFGPDVKLHSNMIRISNEIDLLNTVGLFWSNGVAVSWKDIRPSDEGYKKIALSTYPFAKKQFRKHVSRSVKKLQENTVSFTPGAKEQLKLIWSKVLGVNPQEINDQSHFIEYGGDSVAAIELTEQLNKQFDVHYELDQIALNYQFEQMYSLIEKRETIDD